MEIRAAHQNIRHHNAIQRTCLLLICGGLAMSLAGCSLPPLQDPKQLDPMIGKSSVAVVQQFGVPSSTYQAKDHLFLAYMQTSTDYSPGTPDWGWGWGAGYGYGYGWNNGFGGGFPPTIYKTSCQTTFELVNDKVVHWIKRGDGC